MTYENKSTNKELFCKLESQAVVNMSKLSADKNVLKLKSLVNVQHPNQIECPETFSVGSLKPDSI